MKRFVCLNACGLGELVMNLDLGLAAFGNVAAVYFERQHASSRVTLYLPWPDWTQSPCPAWEQGDLSCPSGFQT